MKHDHDCRELVVYKSASVPGSLLGLVIHVLRKESEVALAALRAIARMLGFRKH